jgi:acyl carrier protein
LMGVIVPSDFSASNQPLPSILQRPLFAYFSHASRGARQAQGLQGVTEVAVLFREATSESERAAIVVRSLAAKLARALEISSEDVDPSNSLSDYGVDSLMAVELREWIGKQFQATVAVFDIMSGAKISAIGDLVVQRTSL